jgi:NhaA family Na+:H+ antiporter
MTTSRRRGMLARFLENEAAGGLVLMLVAALALVIANSPFSPLYFELLHTPLGGLDVLHWINDALMAVFFLLVGLEIKRELVDGQLSTWGQRILPGFAAALGMAVPAAIFLFFTSEDPVAARGWAIPSATDIAFALGVLALLGPRVPASLKVFLAALAILDDLGAVVIIAVFYTAGLDLAALGIAIALIAALIVLNRLNVQSLVPYLLLGAVLWFFVFRSGVHATLAGVILAFTIPIQGANGLTSGGSPLLKLEHAVSPWVGFLVVPVFGFANAGVSLAGLSFADLLAPVPLGAAAGLFLGKQIGVFAACWIALKLGWARCPDRASWIQVYGVALLCGIGFTMSLFIGLLSFDSALLQDEAKLGVLLGSFCSGLLGFIVLRMAKPAA